MSSSLFLVFEPTALWGLSLNWLSLCCFFMLPMVYLAKTNQSSLFLKEVVSLAGSNSKDTLTKSALPVSGLLLTTLLIWASLNNFLGLGPYFFTASSHLVFGLSLALPVWGGHMVVYFMYFNDELMSHLIPSGTPGLLVTLMIMIEFISTLIRPATLMFRLTANMIAGHLLVVLLSSSAVSPSSVVLVSVMAALIILLVLEVFVSLIQAYVFYLLSSLYLVDLVGSSPEAEAVIKSQNL